MIYGKKPIMSPEVEAQVLDAVSMYVHHQKWGAWGLKALREQGAGILLKGPSGTGKTTIARYLALMITKRGMHEISFADFGSHIPGENARQIREIFKYGKENKNMTLFLDECEAVLWERTRAGATAMWMLEVIDELLAQIGKYKGLIILASNRDELLDSAIDRRMLATIHVDIPDYKMRLALWRTKVPKTFPLKLTIEQTEKLANLVLTGAEIEIAIINCASEALRMKKNPAFATLQHKAKILADIRQAKTSVTTGGTVS